MGLVNPANSAIRAVLLHRVRTSHFRWAVVKPRFGTFFFTFSFIFDVSSSRDNNLYVVEYFRPKQGSVCSALIELGVLLSRFCFSRHFGNFFRHVASFH